MNLARSLAPGYSFIGALTIEAMTIGAMELRACRPGSPNQRELLTRSPVGRPGGELTPKAERLLKRAVNNRRRRRA